MPTADYININVDATVNVKISNQPDKLRLAAENFLNKNTEYIAGVAREVLEGNVREIVGKMALEEMVSDRQKFAELVKENAEPDLAAMGLEFHKPEGAFYVFPSIQKYSADSESFAKPCCGRVW